LSVLSVLSVCLPACCLWVACMLFVCCLCVVCVLSVLSVCLSRSQFPKSNFLISWRRKLRKQNLTAVVFVGLICTLSSHSKCFVLCPCVVSLLYPCVVSLSCALVMSLCCVLVLYPCVVFLCCVFVSLCCVLVLRPCVVSLCCVLVLCPYIVFFFFDIRQSLSHLFFLVLWPFSSFIIVMLILLSIVLQSCLISCVFKLSADFSNLNLISKFIFFPRSQKWTTFQELTNFVRLKSSKSETYSS